MERVVVGSGPAPGPGQATGGELPPTGDGRHHGLAHLPPAPAPERGNARGRADELLRRLASRRRRDAAGLRRRLSRHVLPGQAGSPAGAARRVGRGQARGQGALHRNGTAASRGGAGAPRPGARVRLPAGPGTRGVRGVPPACQAPAPRGPALGGSSAAPWKRGRESLRVPGLPTAGPGLGRSCLGSGAHAGRPLPSRRRGPWGRRGGEPAARRLSWPCLPEETTRPRRPTRRAT